MNPVVETFEELFKPLQEARVAAKAEEERPLPTVSSLFDDDFFDRAIQVQINQAFGTKKTVFKVAGNTITYDVNNPATWEKFEPPVVDWSFTVPEPPKRKGKK